MVDRLLQRKSEKSYPSSNSDEDLANAFMDFFVSKIERIRCDIESGRDDNSLPADFSVECGTCMSTFVPLGDTQVLNLIKGRKIKILCS